MTSSVPHISRRHRKAALAAVAIQQLALRFRSLDCFGAPAPSNDGKRLKLAEETSRISHHLWERRSSGANTAEKPQNAKIQNAAAA